jgi:double-stranded uracil-DNA glycosylase
MPRLNGLPLETGKSPRVLILGSFPSTRSLQTLQYYANPKNQFWKIIERLLGIPAVIPYSDRIEALRSGGIALWDIIHSCERIGAMDYQIRKANLNDIAAVLEVYPLIQLIVTNGRTAGSYLSKAYPSGFPGVVIKILPSTSPANARMSPEEKAAAWSAIVSFVQR